VSHSSPELRRYPWRLNRRFRCHPSCSLSNDHFVRIPERFQTQGSLRFSSRFENKNGTAAPSRNKTHLISVAPSRISAKARRTSGSPLAIFRQVISSNHTNRSRTAAGCSAPTLCSTFPSVHAKQPGRQTRGAMALHRPRSLKS